MMIVAMTVCCMAASAQNEVGQLTLQPKVGLSAANLTDTKWDDESGGFMPGLVAGVEAEYGVSEKFSLAAGLLYSMQGTDFGSEKVTMDGVLLRGYDKNQRKLDYLNIPIVANYYVAKGFAIKAGIQPGFLVRAKAKIDGIGSTATIDTDMKDNCKTFDLSIPLGLSYETHSFVIDGRYNLGLTKVNKDGDNSSKNSVIQLTLGYKIAL